MVLTKDGWHLKFRDLKDLLIRDHTVLRITDNHVRERLLRIADLTLEKAIEISKASESKYSESELVEKQEWKKKKKKT